MAGPRAGDTCLTPSLGSGSPRFPEAGRDGSVSATTESIALIGTEARLVEVEVSVGSGIPGCSIVGLPARSVKEAEQRTRAAMEASGFRWPNRRMVANLAPGALRKEGTHFDLAFALGILAEEKQIDDSGLEGYVAIGELALDGAVRPVRGALAAAIAAHQAGRKGLICPAGNAPEAALVSGLDVVPVSALKDCIAWVKRTWEPPPVETRADLSGPWVEDMREVRGHPTAKRALEIAAAGGHNLLMCESRYEPPGLSARTSQLERWGSENQIPLGRRSELCFDSDAADRRWNSDLDCEPGDGRAIPP